MTNLNKDNFEQEVIRSEIPVFVDFWSDVCFQCIAIEPTLEKLENKFKDKIKFAKANVNDIGDIATKCEIFGLPTLILFNNGEIVNKIIGNRPYGDFEKVLNKI